MAPDETVPGALPNHFCHTGLRIREEATIMEVAGSMEEKMCRRVMLSVKSSKLMRVVYLARRPETMIELW